MRYFKSVCASWSDWFAIVPRALARRYFDMTSDLSCTWLECIQRQHGERAVLKAGSCLYNEALHIKWLLDGGVTVRAAPPFAQLANASGWSTCDDAQRIKPDDVGERLPTWLHLLRSRVRGPGQDLMMQVKAAAERKAAFIPSVRTSTWRSERPRKPTC